MIQKSSVRHYLKFNVKPFNCFPEGSNMCLCSFGPNASVHTYDVTNSKVTYFKYDLKDRSLVIKKQEQAGSEAFSKEKGKNH